MTPVTTAPPAPVAIGDVHVVVVNWNTIALLRSCLLSVTAAGVERVTVVDNGSTDDSVSMVRAAFPATTIITNDENVGLTRAFNQALPASDAPWLLRLDSDAELRPGCIERMLERAALDPRTAVVGPRLSYLDGRFQRWTAGRTPTITAALVTFLRLDRWRPKSGVYLGADTSTAFQPEWVSGACILVRRAALDEVGSFDESLLYMDDVDLCRRVRDAGWHVWYEPGADAMHVMGATTAGAIGQSSPEAIRQLNAYVDSHEGRVVGRGVRVVQAAGFAARAAAYAAHGRVSKSNKDRELAAARAHWQRAKWSLEGIR